MQNSHAYYHAEIVGPYIPLDDRYYITPRMLFDEIRVFHSWKCWVGHEHAMAKSAHHAQIMLGEIDEPDYSDSGYSPAASASDFGISTAISVAQNALDGERPITDRHLRICVTSCLVQLLFFIIGQDEVLAQIARYKRTGYLGHPSQTDLTNAIHVRNNLRTAISPAGMDGFQKAFETGEYDKPVPGRQGRHPRALLVPQDIDD